MLSQWNVGLIFLDLWLLLEMSDEVRSFHPSVRPAFFLKRSLVLMGARVGA